MIQIRGLASLICKSKFDSRLERPEDDILNLGIEQCTT